MLSGASAAKRVETYVAHRPKETLLYQLVEKYYPTLKSELSQQGSPLPRYVEKEFEAYLECGCPEHGFFRVRCDGCRREHLLAFSCKRRGFYFGHPALRPSGQLKLFKSLPAILCPSCGARRIGNRARVRNPSSPRQGY